MSFRIRGFLIHLLVSCTLALVASYIVFMIWYPSPLAEAIGVTSIVLLLLGVDVIAGPLLTLAVCKKGKKSLKFDLSVIVLIQLSAFVYGIYIIAEGRPIWIALHRDEFNVVQAYEMNHIYREKAENKYRELSFTGPKWVGVREPVGDERKTIIEGIYAGVSFPKRADLYEPLTNKNSTIKETALPLSELNQFNDPSLVKEIISKWPEANAFLPLIARDKPLTVLIKRDTGEVITIIQLNPMNI